MKKTKILTILGVMLAMGLTACGGGNTNKESSKPAGESSQQQGGESSQQGGASSQQGGESSQQGGGSSQQGGGSSQQAAEKDQTGHIWGAEADVAGDAEAGTVAYKRAECTENDGAVKYAVNQSVFSYEKGGRKSGTPEGYTKLNANGDIMSVKFNSTKYLVGKMYLYGCMDGWSSNSSKNAFAYNGKANIEVKVNGEALDIDALKNVVYTDFLSGSGSDYSDDGYGFVGDIVLVPGVNYVTYKRVASMNTLVKDFVFVGKEFDSEWRDGEAVAAADGSIAYTKYANNFDPDKVKIEWKALDGTFAEGSKNKSGTPDGYLKLNSNGNEISYAFAFDADLDGQIYQRGAMDNYSSNQTRTYYSQQSGAKYGNFEMKANGSTVYFGDRKDVTYLELLGEGANPDTEKMSGYSEVKDCLIGDAFIKNGANAFSFKRLDSFNLAVSDFVFIGKKAAAHTNPAADAAYEGKDSISHWQVAANDQFKFNRADHQWVADDSETDTASTCTVKGVKHYKCSVCGEKMSEELPLAEHTWESDPDLASTDTASTCTTHGVAHVRCSVCGAKAEQELPLGAHSWGEAQAALGDAVPHECSACHGMCYELAVASPAKLKSDLTWNVTGLPAGKYQVVLSACAASTTLTQDIVSGGSGRYQFRFGSEGDYVSPASGTYASYGFGTGEKIGNVQWTNPLCEVTAAEGAASFTIHYGGQGYSAFIAAVRLVKVAA